MDGIVSQLHAETHPTVDEPPRTRQRELLAVRGAFVLLDWRLAMAIIVGGGGLRLTLRVGSTQQTERGSEQ